MAKSDALTGNQGVVDVFGSATLVDDTKRPEPVDYSSRESATPEHRQFFDSLHMGEGYVLFGINLEDFSTSESDDWAVAVIEKGGTSARLVEEVISKSDRLLELLGGHSAKLTLLHWNEELQAWDDPSQTFKVQSDSTPYQFADLSLCYSQDNYVFGLMVCLAKDDSYDNRLTALHNDGLSKLIALYEREREASAQAAQALLSEGERNVLLWCANGKTSFEISRILNLSEHTVNHYIAAAARKLDATNRPHAIAKAIKAKLIDVDEIG